MLALHKVVKLIEELFAVGLEGFHVLLIAEPR